MINTVVAMHAPMKEYRKSADIMFDNKAHGMENNTHDARLIYMP